MRQEISVSQKTTFPVFYNRFLLINLYAIIQFIFLYMFIISEQISAC